MNQENTLTLIYRLSRLPVRVYDSEGRKRLDIGAIPNESTLDLQISQALHARLRDSKAVFIPYHARIPLGICGCRGEEATYILGPFCYGQMDAPEAREFVFANHLGDYPFCRLESVEHILHFLSGDAIDRQELPERNEVDNPAVEELGQLEAFQENHTYLEEQRLYGFIRNGNVEELKKHISDVLLPHPLLLDEIKKNEEYMVVTGVSLAARAAIEGGLSSREAFLYNDLFLKKVAACGEAWEMHDVQKECYLCFASLVRTRRQQGKTINLHVEECKRAIIAGRFEKLSIESLAKNVGVAKEYLQKLFKKCEGVSITEYIAAQKLEVACDLLIFSDRKISEIADYLHFGSAGHFSITFKRKMHVSPNEFRKMHRPTNF